VVDRSEAYGDALEGAARRSLLVGPGVGASIGLADHQQQNLGAQASSASVSGMVSAAAIVVSVIRPAISGASPPSWRAST